MSRINEVKEMKIGEWIVMTQLCILIGLHFCEITPLFYL